MEWVNDSLGKLSCTDFALEQNIEFSVSAIFWFRKSEERPNNTNKAETSPKETTLTPPVPGRWVQHVRDDDTVDNAKDVVRFLARTTDLMRSRVEGSSETRE